MQTYEIEHGGRTVWAYGENAQEAVEAALRNGSLALQPTGSPGQAQHVVARPTGAPYGLVVSVVCGA